MGKRRKRKKKCFCDKSNQSSIPCGQCIRKSASKKNRANQEEHRNRKKKNRKMSETSSPTSHSSRSEKPTYAVLGTTILSIMPPEASEIFPKLRASLDSGVLTDLAILVPFWASSRHARRHIARILAERDGSWAINHLVFQWPHEQAEAFVLRASNVYEVTHFFDVDRVVLESLAKSPNNLQRVIQYFPEEPDAWQRIEAWLTKTCPTYVPVLEKAQEAGVILGL